MPHSLCQVRLKLGSIPINRPRIPIQRIILPFLSYPNPKNSRPLLNLLLQVLQIKNLIQAHPWKHGILHGSFRKGASISRNVLRLYQIFHRIAA